jgi:hypothetical protein
MTPAGGQRNKIVHLLESSLTRLPVVANYTGPNLGTSFSSFHQPKFLSKVVLLSLYNYIKSTLEELHWFYCC